MNTEKELYNNLKELLKVLRPARRKSYSEYKKFRDSFINSYIKSFLISRIKLLEKFIKEENNGQIRQY